MRLYSVFNRLAEIPGSPYLILKCEYDKEGKIYKHNRKMEDLLLNAGLLTEPLLSGLFPDSLLPDFASRMMNDLENESVTIRNLAVNQKRTSFLCFEKINPRRDRILFIAIPFDKANVLQLLQMYSRFEGYYNSNPDIVIAMDARWRIMDINRAGMIKLGYSEKQEFLNKNRDEIFILSSEAWDYILSEIRKGNSITEFEIILKKRTGGFITAFSSIFSIDYDMEEEQIFYFHLKDLTLQTQAMTGQIQMNLELTELNEELNRAHAAMVSQEKMAALGLLAAGLAHEINNPLGFVFNNITVLMNHFKDLRSYIASVRNLYVIETDLPEIEGLSSLDNRLELDYIFDDILSIEKENSEGVERIKKIISSMQSFSQNDSLSDKNYLDLNKAVRDMLTVTRNEYKYKVNVREDYGETHPILCNALEINQVLLSLFMNSVESIKKQKRRDMGQIRIETSEDDKNVYFTITDDGTGVPREIRGKIFDPFFTTKPVGSGTGLGLAVAQDIIINRHGGSLKLMSNDKPGAKIGFSLPRQDSMEVDL